MFLFGLVAFAVAAALTPLLATWARRRNLLDIPNQRSSHRIATPRLGGVAFVLAFLVGMWVAHFYGISFSTASRLVVGAACALAVVGLVDDLRTLPALLRLVIYVGVSVLVASTADVSAFPAAVPTGVAIALMALWMTAVTNAFNFMDGIDGIAAGQAVITGLGWAIVGQLIGSNNLTALGLLGAAAPAGFLLYNWAPAKVFMGDAGSAFLGFLFAALPLAAGEPRPDLWACAVLLLWPFLFDTALTLARRIGRRENILAAHRSHLYQRLTATGLAHSKVAVLYGGLAVMGAVAAAAVANDRPRAGLVSAVVLGFAALGLWRYVVVREAATAR